LIKYGCLLLGLVFFASCENDLRDVERIAARNVEIPVDKSYDVEIIYSDSAVVKGKLITPQLFHYKTTKPYYEMTKGITLIMFDKQQQETSRVTADYAIRRETEKMVESKRNAVVVNKEGKTFKSDELIWEENKQRFYSNKLVSIVTPSQTIYGTGFWANEDFTYYEIRQSTGNFDISGEQTGLE